MIILPSRGRPDQLARFFASSQPGPSGILLLDEDDKASHDAALPAGWCCVIGPRRGNIEWCNEAFKLFPHEPWYACLGDDMECGPPGWDERLARAAGAWGLAYADDGINGEKHPAVPFLGGELVRAVGWIAPPGMRHGLFYDNLWSDIATALGTRSYHPDLKTLHRHWSTPGGQPFDATARERPIHNDGAVYRAFHDTGAFAQLIERIKGMQA